MTAGDNIAIENAGSAVGLESGASGTASVTSTVSNTNRLRGYLTKDGLAASLLSAWEQGEPAGSKARMLAAINEFYAQKRIHDDETTNQSD